MRKRKPKSSQALVDLESLEIDGQEFNLSEEMELRRENIEETYETHSESFAYWRTLLAKSRNRRRILDKEYNQVYAVRYRQWYSKCENDGRTPTVDLVANLTLMDKQVLSAESDLEGAQEEHEILQSIVDMFEHKKVCIMGLGALHRIELEAGRNSVTRRPAKS
jgi:hypothetical protein